MFLKPLSCVVSVQILIFFTGCAPRIEEKKNDSLGPKQIESWDLLAEDYFVEDLACQDETGLEAVGDQDIHQFGGGSTQPRSHSFQDFSSAESFQGPGFDQSIYNFQQQSKCTETAGAETCESGSRIVSPAKKLKICKRNANFARASIEGVALSSVSSLDGANKFYLTIPNARPALKEATVIVLPIVEKIVTKKNTDGSEISFRSLLTDNLAFTSNFDGRPAFVVFPKSRNAVSKGRWQNLNLWELPWGMTHEFGHHVFRSHTGIEKLPGTLTTVHGLQFGTPIHSINFDETTESEPGFSLAARTSGAEEVFSSINEGYADLYAYFALGQSSELTKGVDCFAVNRDITSAQFVNGAAKSLNTSVLEIFNASEPVKANSCDGPNFQDVHSIGAVIAHGVMLLYRSRAAVSGADSAQQAGWLLAWAEAIGDAVRAGGRKAVTLDDMLKLAIKGVAESDGSLTRDQCKTIRSVFPAYAEAWLASSFTCNP